MSKYTLKQPKRDVVDTRILSVNDSLTLPADNAYEIRKIAGGIITVQDENSVKEVTEDGIAIAHGAASGHVVIKGNGKIRLSRAEEDAEPEPVVRRKPKPKKTYTRR